MIPQIYLHTLETNALVACPPSEVWCWVNSQPKGRKSIEMQRQFTTDKTELYKYINKDVRGVAVQVVEWHELRGSHGYWSSSR